MLRLADILYPRDFSPTSDTARTWVVRLARATGATVHAFHARVLHEGQRDATLGPTHMEPSLRERLLAGLEHADPDGPFDVRPVSARAIAPAAGIVDYATVHDADLIVMGTHGRSGLSHAVLGSVATEVVRLAPCPVLTVRTGREPEDVRTILVPTDLSAHSAAALRHAHALAAMLDARLQLLHVVEPSLHPAFYNTGVFSIYDVDPDLDERALAAMKRFYARVIGHDDRSMYTVVSGRAAHEIIRYAREAAVGMIVMGTHGMTGLERFLMGSVAEKVVRRAPCPVFTIKSFGRQFVAPAAAASETQKTT